MDSVVSGIHERCRMLGIVVHLAFSFDTMRV